MHGVQGWEGGVSDSTAGWGLSRASWGTPPPQSPQVHAAAILHTALPLQRDSLISEFGYLVVYLNV